MHTHDSEIQGKITKFYSQAEFIIYINPNVHFLCWNVALTQQCLREGRWRKSCQLSIVMRTTLNWERHPVKRVNRALCFPNVVDAVEPSASSTHSPWPWCWWLSSASPRNTPAEGFLWVWECAQTICEVEILVSWSPRSTMLNEMMGRKSWSINYPASLLLEWDTTSSSEVPNKTVSVADSSIH